MTQSFIYTCLLATLTLLDNMTMAPPVMRSVEGACPQQHLRTLTLNIWGLPGIIRKDASRIPEIIKHLDDYDVVAVQEAFAFDAREQLRAAGFPYVVLGQRGRWPLKFVGNGLAILSRCPIKQTDEVLYDTCLYADCFSRKGALFARIEMGGGQPVDVYVTHLQAGPKGGAEDMIRRAQLNQLIDFRGQHHLGYPTLLMGDMNIDAKTNLYAPMLAGLNMQDAWHVEKTGNKGYTHALRNSWSHATDTPTRLDYTLYDAGTNNKLSIESIGLAFDTPIDGRHLSDHFGVTTLISIMP